LRQSPIFGIVKYRLLLFFCGLSLLLIILWQQLFHLPFSIIPYHMAVMVPVHIFCISIIALVYRWWPSRFYMVAKVGSWGLMVALFYLLIFGSVHFWGDIITLRILGTYLRDFGSFLRSLPFSYIEMCAAIIVFVSIPYVLAYVFSKKIAAALVDMAESLIAHKKIILALVLVSLLSTPLLIKAKRVIHKSGEPLMVMLFDHMWGVTDNPLFSQRRIQAGFADQQLRKAYKQEAMSAARKNVILIIVDALRADHLSAYGYKRKTSPFLDGLLAEGKAVKAERCYSTCACTLCGVTSILLSRTWNESAVNGFNLVGLLHDRGYHNYALISGAHKEWYNMAKFYSDDCDYFDGKDAKRYYFKDDRVLLEGMERIHGYADTPSFFYFHLQSAHETGLLQDKYAVYKPFKKSITTQGMNGEAAMNEYDNKVLQADDMIRQLFEALEQKGYLKNSMVVITADHGQGLGEHGVSGHVDWLYDPQVSVPLIIYDDSISLYRNLSFARHIDIAPTIVDRLHLPKPASWMGLSLLQDSVALYSYHETGKNGLETGQAKYMVVFTPKPAEGGLNTALVYKYIFTEGFQKEELYELVSDPTEGHDLAASQKQMLEQMRAKAKLEMKRMFGND
jgi:glucan phosphoethanolaminetransferase (alkaline phosphatase superfamily)